MDPITILAALGPLAVDLGKSLINRFIAPSEFKPATVDDWLKMRESDLAMFNAMNNAGGTNPTYLWVEAIIRLMRPAVALIVLGVWAYAHATKQVDTGTIDNFAAAIGFYLFGDRTLFYSRQGKAPSK